MTHTGLYDNYSSKSSLFKTLSIHSSHSFQSPSFIHNVHTLIFQLPYFFISHILWSTPTYRMIKLRKCIILHLSVLSSFCNVLGCKCSKVPKILLHLFSLLTHYMSSTFSQEKFLALFTPELGLTLITDQYQPVSVSVNPLNLRTILKHSS